MQGLERRRAAPPRCPQDRFDGRGIVICAGGERYFTCAWVLIAVLREAHRCDLPIQLWHLGRGEMSEEMRLLLVERGVEVVDAASMVARYPARISGGWPLKPYAIAHSRFREVLYLDADLVPLVDPVSAFDWQTMREHGLLLWPDSLYLAASNPAWVRLGLSPAEQVSIDSGILLADKARAWDVLDLAVLMNEHCDELYDVLYGDKDTFMLAAQVLGRPFGLVGHPPVPFGWDRVQRDPEGAPFAHHRSGSKWTLARPNRPMSDSALDPVCEAALADLRRRWSGIVFHAPERSARARAEEARLVALRKFRYEAGPNDVRDFELLTGGRVGEGARLERNWAVEDREGALSLVLYAGHRAHARLDKDVDGLWRGDNGAPGSDIRLYEAIATNTSAAPRRRSCGDILAALLDPAFFSGGYDENRATALATALSLINETHDDAPEQLGRRLDALAVPPAWRARLGKTRAQLAAARDRRLALVEARAMKSGALTPGNYVRP